MLKRMLWCLFSILAAFPAFAAPQRLVFLNGVDISTAKNQTLKQVNVKIDGFGNLYIEAPQYEAQQETTFVPLGKQAQAPFSVPEHKSPGPLTPNVQSAPADQGELALPAQSSHIPEQPESNLAPESETAPIAKEGTRKDPNDARAPAATSESPSKNPQAQPGAAAGGVRTPSRE